MSDGPEEQARNRRAGNNGVVPPAEHRFRPGESGNPNGRPPGRSLTALLCEALDADAAAGYAIPEGRSVAEALARKAVELALAGDFRFYREILNRTDGKVAEKIDLRSAVGPLFPGARQRAALANPRALELMCELDECLIDSGAPGS